MKRVAVIGSIGHDRVWHLTSPLVAGERLRYSARVIRLGGGGYYTARHLRELGAEVSLISCLKSDGIGQKAAQTLLSAGFDIQHVERPDGETRLLDVLLEPSGERTIIADETHIPPTYTIDGRLDVDALYINALVMDDKLIRQVERAPLVMTQLPLLHATPRPADYVVTSRSDVGGSIEDIWDQAKMIAGPRLRSIIVTDGPRPVGNFDGSDLSFVVPKRDVASTDFIGAGDTFSAAVLFALLEGQDLTRAIAFANEETAGWLQRR